ncbi:MAG: hypothetical protein WC716_13210 [Chitinophagaceae bacterium]|jgi:hypothetical protein
MKKIMICLICIAVSVLPGCRKKDNVIKIYEFPVTIDRLDKAIREVIAENKQLHIDSTREVITTSANKDLGELLPEYYNSRELFISMKIFLDTNFYYYTFRYCTAKTIPATDAGSRLDIISAFDLKGNGGTAADGDVTNLKPLLKKRITALFENKFISKVDLKLGVTHKEID